MVSVLREIAAGLGKKSDTVELIIVDDDFIRGINRDYRGMDRPTDVISFSYADSGSPAAESEDVVGEVYVSYETVLRDADTSGADRGVSFLRIGVHGLLHVVGYDHRKTNEAGLMESEEKRLLLEHLDPAEVEELF
ncbi:MAG: rRNA maturation RNase YbeY [bacterium]